MALHAPGWISVVLLSLNSGCATTPTVPVPLDSDGRKVVIQPGKPVRKHRVVGTFKFKQESELSEIRNRARAMGADAIVVSVVRTRYGGGNGGGAGALGPLGLVVAIVQIAGAFSALPSEEVSYFVARAIQWTEESAEFLSEASLTSSTPKRLVARANTLRADFDAHPGDEATFSEYLLSCEQLDDRASAHTAWERFLMSAAPNPSHRLAYASWLWSHGLGPEALVQARIVRQTTPSPRGAASLVGRILAQQGQSEEARAELERALQEEPDDLDATAALAALAPKNK
jgi:hypothetical protein